MGLPYLFPAADLSVSNDDDGLVGVHAEPVQRPEVLGASVVGVNQLALQVAGGELTGEMLVSHP